ncbi:nucleotidyltransferase family protein [Bradyrhizobium sp.]|jgi:hypothetical protein|uniref:nucleotidyltransferase family protein n=1 Tax=Bradyrhizobium sp. TaxID=376 RepID=UPI002DF81621|nr:nucleotidyltransferase family protein [Bradyrhizobium sp.]
MNGDEFRKLVLCNLVNDALLDEVMRLDLPDAWIVSGCLTQTIWNIRTRRAIDYGINDYDVFYFDPDLSWEAEDRAIGRLRETSTRLGVRIEVRNQARVHLWYQQKHGTFYPPLRNSAEGIDRFLTRCTQVGLQRGGTGDHVYAPSGFDELESMTVRPNFTPSFSAAAYRKKTARWLSLWPELTVVSPVEIEATK